MLSTEQEKKILERVFYILKVLDDKLENKKLVKTVAMYLREQASFENKKEFASHVSIDLSLNQIREMTSSPIYGRGIPSLWFPILYKRTNITEAERFLDHTSFYQQLSNDEVHSLWLFENYFPFKKQHRKIIIERYLKLRDSERPYLKDMFFRLQQNDDIKSALISIDKKYRRPLILEKRKFYKSMLQQRDSFPYAIYQLIKLGDLDASYILWAF